MVSKVFKYVKSHFNYERKVHNMTVSELDMPTFPIQSYSDLCSYRMSTVTSKSNVMPGDDHVYNYGCLHLSIRLLLRNADDSVKEADGERLMRVWKFLTLFYRCGGSHKYALAGLQGSFTSKFSRLGERGRKGGLKTAQKNIKTVLPLRNV